MKSFSGVYLTLAVDMTDFDMGNWIGAISLKITAEDKGNPSLSSSVDLQVSVVEPNSHAPEFTTDLYRFSVEENSAKGTVVGTVSATDKDSENSLEKQHYLTYSLIKEDQGIEELKFSIDSVTGEVIVNGSNIDFETQEIFTMLVQVVDSDVPSLSSTASVIIELIDLNDNVPFLRPHSAEGILISGEDNNLVLVMTENLEPQTEILNLTEFVVDLDQNYDQGWSFELKNFRDTFEIDESSGSLAVLKVLSCESWNLYRLEVEIVEKSDPGTPGLFVVTILIADSVNEFEPQFDPEFYFWPVPENIPVGTTMGEVKADDNDCSFSEEYRKLLDQYPTMSQYTDSISYFLLPSQGSNISEFLKIHSTTGQVSVKKSLELKILGGPLNGQVLAVNEASPKRSKAAGLTIDVIDVNEAPVFTQSWFNLSMEETNLSNEYLLTVEAFDYDYLEQFTEFFYSLDAEMNEVLSLDSQTGEITSKVPLDRELYPGGWTFTVYATDAADSSLFSTAQVFIEILDINDNAPQPPADAFKNGSVFTISENLPSGTIILTIDNISDPDKPPNQGPFTFEVISPSDLVFFDRNTNRLRSSQVFDKEIQEDFVITIQISDNGDPPMKTVLEFLLTILDENDNPSQRTEITTFANVFPNTNLVFPFQVAKVHPKDKDSTANFFTCRQVSTWTSFAEIDDDCSLYLKEYPQQFEASETVTANALVQFLSDDGKHQQVVSDVQLIVNQIPLDFEDRLVFIRIEGSNLESFVAQNLIKLSESLHSLIEVPVQVISFLEAHLQQNSQILVLIVSTLESTVSNAQLQSLLKAKQLQLSHLSETFITSVTLDLCESMQGICANEKTCSYDLQKITDFSQRSIFASENSIFSSVRISLELLCTCDGTAGCQKIECGWDLTTGFYKTCENGGTCSFTSDDGGKMIPGCSCTQNLPSGSCESNEEKVMNSLCDDVNCGSDGVCSPPSGSCMCRYPATGEFFPSHFY